MRVSWKGLGALSAGLALLMALTACGGGATGGTTPAAPTVAGSPQLDSLVAAAKQENCLTVYGVPDESTLKALADAFTTQYGIPVSTVRLVSADLAQRFSTEADAAAPVADVVLLTHSAFYADALAKGWLDPVDKAGIPAFPGTFPTDFTADGGATPIAQLVATSMVYNSSTVEKVPDSWQAYADPAYQGQLLFAEPTTSPANLAFWQLMRKEYGDGFLEKVAANKPRWYNSAVPATQAVAAGEGEIGFPGVTSIVASLKQANAPVETVRLSPTTGPEIALGLTHGSPCANAGKLFANYVLSAEGNGYMNQVSGDISPYAPEAAGFVRPAPVSKAEKQQIVQLLHAS